MNKKTDSCIIRQNLLWMVLCAVLLSQPFTVYAARQYEVTKTELVGTITTDSALNVRSGPGKEYEAFEKVRQGEVLHITGQTENGWYQIELDGQLGYVSAQYVSAQEADADSSSKGDSNEDSKEDVIGEPEEGYRGLHQSPQMKKIIAIAAVIGIVLIMIVITLMKMRSEEDLDDEYDEDDDAYDDDEYDEDDDAYDDDEDEDTDDAYEDDDTDNAYADGKKIHAGEERNISYGKRIIGFM